MVTPSSRSLETEWKKNCPKTFRLEHFFLVSHWSVFSPIGKIIDNVYSSWLSFFGEQRKYKRLCLTKKVLS